MINAVRVDSECVEAVSVNSVLSGVLTRHNILLGRLIRDYPGAVPLVLPVLEEDEVLFRYFCCISPAVFKNKPDFKDGPIEKNEKNDNLNDNTNDEQMDVI